jgi:catecholate siderophore receptor
MRFFTHFSAAALLLALGHTGYAQSAPALASELMEDEIIVTARYLSIDKINAVKTPTPIINVPQSLSIIDDVQIKAQAFTSIGDITRYSTGLNISQGEGHRDAIIIRGNQTTADFFQDGVRDDVQYFRPLYNLEQVEILRGANALLFGRGGVGGIINRVTKKPDSGGAFTGLTASLDTFGAHSLAADINTPLSETAGFRLNAFFEGLNTHRDFFDGRRFAVNPTANFALSRDSDLTLSYEYLDDDRTVDRGVPSQNVNGGPDVPLEGFNATFFGSPDENFTTLQAHILRGRLDHKFSENLRGNLTAQYADYDKVYQNLFASENVQVTNGLFSEVELDGYRDTTARQNSFIQGNLVGEFETGRLSHTVLMGAEYGVQNTDNARTDNVFAANGDDQLFIPFTDPLTIPAFGFDSPARDRASEVTVFSVYLQDQISLTKRLKILLGGRFDSFDIDVNDIMNQGQFARGDEEFTPRLGAIYKPQENISLYTSYSETFLPRSGDQFLTLNLNQSQTQPQKTVNLEAGLKWDIQPRLSLTTAIFEVDRSSVVTLDSENSDVLDVIDGNVVQGFELQLQGKLTNNWSINAGYSYLNGNVQDLGSDGTAGSNDGNEPRQTPQNMFHLWNNVQLTQAFGLGLGATYQDSYFVREDNAVRVPDYIRLDAAAYYNLPSGVRLQVNIENLLNTDYFPDAHSNDNISTGKPLNARFTISSVF